MIYNKSISVVMPVWNCDRYISEAIESILKQTHTSFELIIINDSSTDKTAKICNLYAKSDKRIRVVHNNRNRGIVYSLNKGISLAKHKWIARMDGDDYSSSDRLLKQINKLVSNNADISFCSYNIVSADKTLIKKQIISENENLFFLKMGYENIAAHSSVIFSKDAYEKCGGYQDTMPAEDYDLWLKMIVDSKISIVTDVVHTIRDNPEGISTKNKQNQISRTENLQKQFWSKNNSIIIDKLNTLSDAVDFKLLWFYVFKLFKTYSFVYSTKITFKWLIRKFKIV